MGIGSKIGNNLFRRTENHTETDPISTHSYPQATATDPSSRPSRHTQGVAQSAGWTNYSEAPTVHSQGYSAKRECYDQVPASSRSRGKPQTRNITHECSAPVYSIRTTSSYPPAEQMEREKFRSDRSREEIPFKGALYGQKMNYTPPTPSQSPQTLPAPPELNISPQSSSNLWPCLSPTSPSSGYPCHSRSHERAHLISPKPTYQATRPYEPVTPPASPPPSHKRAPKRSSEPVSDLFDPSAMYGSGAGYNAPPQSSGHSSKPERGNFDCTAIYNNERTGMHYEPRSKQVGVVLAASHSTRTDKNRLNGFENPSRQRTRNPVKELNMDSEELDDFSFGLMGEILEIYHGREGDLIAAVHG
ncbi:hypothetical protein RSAG8_11490, partial [Rhizoctonia solani AG-8 WAC10335]